MFIILISDMCDMDSQAVQPAVLINFCSFVFWLCFANSGTHWPSIFAQFRVSTRPPDIQIRYLWWKSFARVIDQHWKTSSTSYWPRPIYIWSSPFAVNSCLKIVFLLSLNNIFHSWPKYFGSFCSDWMPTTHFWCIPNKVLFSSIKENYLWISPTKTMAIQFPTISSPWQGFSFPCSRCKSGKLWQVDTEPTLGIVYSTLTLK